MTTPQMPDPHQGPQPAIRGNIDTNTMFTGRWRDRVCPRCGAPFVQHELSPRFQKWLDAFGAVKAALFREYASDNALPLLCIPCERKDLSYTSPPPPKPLRGLPE